MDLEELMRQDCEVYMELNKQFGYDLEIIPESNPTIKFEGVHPLAIESLAHFCRQFLTHYERLEDEQI